MDQEITYAGATELAGGIRNKTLSPIEVLQAHLDRIDAVNPKLNALVTMADDAMDKAREAEAAIMRGEVLGPLHGVPFTAKDSVDVAGVRTTRGSKLFEHHVPDADAAVVTRLKEAGGIFLGHTNVPEFVFRVETDNVVFGRTENPWKKGRTAGGSSGGEGAALAAGLSPLGIGSDVGGSIRLPAGYSGVFGLKATHGRIPLTGHWPDALLRYMHVGPMARTVRDIAVALQVVAGPDGLDPYAMPVPVPDFDDLEDGVRGLRVGWCAEGPFAPVAQEVQDTVEQAASALDEMGCQVEPVSLSSWEELDGQRISMTIFTAEVKHAVEPLVSGREDELSPALRERLAIPAPSAREYQSALADCELLRADTARLFTEFDLLLSPNNVVPAHPHDVTELEVDERIAIPRHALTATVPFDLTGSPAISAPFGWSNEGLPISVQIAGRHFEEPTVLRAAHALENLREVRRPTL